MVPFKQEGWKLKPEHSMATGESSEESAGRAAGPPSPCLEERQRTGKERTEIGSRNHVRRLGTKRKQINKPLGKKAHN